MYRNRRGVRYAVAGKRILCLLDRPAGRRCLDHLSGQTAWEVVGVVSRRDGERQWWGVSDFAETCRARSIPWFDHRRRLTDIVSKTRPDVVLSVLFTKVVPGEIVRAVPCFNLHGAPLPAYRGFNSTLWAILNGDRRFGATLHEMAERVDCGDIVDMATFAVPAHITNVELYRLAQDAAYDVLVRSLPRIHAGSYRPRRQTGKTRYYGKDEIPSREVSLAWPRSKISRFVRAFWFPPFDPAYLVVDGQRLDLVPGEALPRAVQRARAGSRT